MKTTTIDRLYREHHDKTLGRLQGALYGQAADFAEDALSDAWVILSRKPDSYLIEDTIGAWLLLTAKRCALRSWGQYKRTLSRVPIEDFELPADDDLHALVVNRDRVRELIDYVTNEDTNMPRRRAVAARIVGVSYKELAATTSTTWTNVNHHTAEGLKHARATTSYEAE